MTQQNTKLHSILNTGGDSPIECNEEPYEVESYKLPGEVKVFDGEGNLKYIIPKEEVVRKMSKKMDFKYKINFRGEKAKDDFK